MTEPWGLKGHHLARCSVWGLRCGEGDCWDGTERRFQTEKRARKILVAKSKDKRKSCGQEWCGGGNPGVRKAS